jgi:ParB family chromosome partitioning protein
VGKSRSHVANTLRLLSLPDSVQHYVTSGEMTAGHARAIANGPTRPPWPRGHRQGPVGPRRRGPGPPHPERRRRGSRQVERRPLAASKDTDTQALEADLSSVLGLDVEIDDRGGTGALTIRYATLEQLDDLCNRLTRGPEALGGSSVAHGSKARPCPWSSCSPESRRWVRIPE